jgi:hypothetical protein
MSPNWHRIARMKKPLDIRSRFVFLSFMINAKTNPRPNDPIADQGAARDSADVPAERHLRMLRELGELGMELARAAQRQALDRIAAEPGGDPP